MTDRNPLHPMVQEALVTHGLGDWAGDTIEYHLSSGFAASRGHLTSCPHNHNSTPQTPLTLRAASAPERWEDCCTHAASTANTVAGYHSSVHALTERDLSPGEIAQRFRNFDHSGRLRPKQDDPRWSQLTQVAVTLYDQLVVAFDDQLEHVTFTDAAVGELAATKTLWERICGNVARQVDGLRETTLTHQVRWEVWLQNTVRDTMWLADRDLRRAQLSSAIASQLGDDRAARIVRKINFEAGGRNHARWGHLLTFDGGATIADVEHRISAAVTADLGADLADAVETELAGIVEQIGAAANDSVLVTPAFSAAVPLHLRAVLRIRPHHRGDSWTAWHVPNELAQIAIQSVFSLPDQPEPFASYTGAVDDSQLAAVAELADSNYTAFTPAELIDIGVRLGQSNTVTP